MPVINVNGNLVRFDDDLTDDQISTEIEKNPTLFDPGYKAPVSMTDRLKGFARSNLGFDPDNSPKTIAEQAEASDGENAAAPQVKGAPVRQSFYNKALLDQTDFTKKRVKPEEGILRRVDDTAAQDTKGQEQQRELEGLRTDENVPEGGFVASAKSMAGQTIRGAGRVASDYLGADKDNALMEYGAELIRNDPVAIRSLNDIKDRPFLAFKEASGNMVPSFGAMMGTAIVGQGIISAAPLTGPAAPVVAAVGAAVKWLGPAAIAALPSYSGIRDKQIFNDPKNEEDAKSKAIAALGAAAVGTIEVAFGPQNWAITMLTKEGRVALARKLAATTPVEAFVKGTILGGLQEGGEELAQNPIEQLSSYDNPLTKENLEDTAFGGAMGFIGGAAPGGVTNALNFMSDQAQSKADRINAERVKLGLQKIESANNVDEAIAAAQEVNSKNVTKDDVLRTEDPTLADIERLTGLKPSEVINNAETQAEATSAEILNSANTSPESRQANEDSAINAPETRQNLANSSPTNTATEKSQHKPVDINSIVSGKTSPSWVIINKESGDALFETYEQNVVDALNTNKYEAVPIYQYLTNLNKNIKDNGGNSGKYTRENTDRNTEIVLPDNTSLKAQWDIVDADSVKASLKEGKSQPRDRTRAASDLQIQSIANNPDYRRLSDSPVMDVGAAVLSNDGQIVGGNGRFEALSRAYDQNTAQDYLDNLRNDAVRKGLDPSVIDGMNKPVLVRRITEPFDTRKLAIASNSGTSAPYSAREKAKIDAERIGDISNLDITDSGDIALTPRNMQIIRDSMNGYTAAEQSSFVDSNGNLSQEGARRFRNAILYNAYGDSDTLTRLIESTDNDMRNVVGALMRVSGDVAKVRQEIKQGAIPKELDITDDLIGAVEKIAQLRSQNIPVQEYLAQQDIFGNGLSDDAKQIVTALHDNIRSQNKIAQFIRDVYEGIGRVNIATGDMLGNQVPSKGEVIQNAKPGKAEQGKIFSRPDSNVTTESGQESKNNDDTKTSNEKINDDVIQGKVGMMLSSGQVVKTLSGRLTTPFPAIKTGKVNTGKTTRAVEQWLMQNALDEALSRNDKFNARIFKADIELQNSPQASKDSAEEYLFGYQPEVQKPFLKPLNKNSESTANADNKESGRETEKVKPLFSKSEKQEDNTLLIQHNISITNLIHADRVGGIAAPSLAITDKSNPLTGFGQITLLGDRNLADPKSGTKVFGADVYSPRYPTVRYQFSDKNVSAFNKEIKPFINLVDGEEIQSYDLDGDQATSARYLEKNPAILAMFLKDQHGINPKLVKVKKPILAQKYKKYIGKNYYEVHEDAEFRKLVEDEYTEFLARKDLISKEEKYDMVSNLGRGVFRRIETYASDIKKAGKVDDVSSVREMQKQISSNKLDSEYDVYVYNLVHSLNPKEQISQRNSQGDRKYSEHNIDNVIGILKRNIRGGELGGVVPGKLRAMVTPEFKSIKHIKDAKGKLVSSFDFSQLRDEMNNDVQYISDQLDGNYKYERNSLSTTIDMLFDAAKGNISGALKEHGYENVSDDIKKEISDLFDKFRNMPTEYFEAKIPREVRISEFSAAVVPKDTPKQALDILAKNGITDIKFYKNRDDRIAKIGSFKKLLFSKSQKQQTSLTKDDIQPLADKYNKKLTYGKIIVLNNIDELPEGTIKLTEITESDKGLVEGVYLGRQRVYIIADAFDNMDRVDMVIQHELSHLATEELLDSKEYKTAIRSVNLLDKSGNKTIRDIAKIVDKRQPGLDADTRAKEILAMSVETGKYKNVSALRRVVADVVRAFKAMLRRLGVKLSIVEKMSEQEVFATMRNAMDMLYSEKNAKQTGQSESLKSAKEQIPETLNIDGIDRPTRNSNGQLIYPTEEGIRNFWKWFGDSNVTDDQGRPLVVYHGTRNAGFEEFKPNLRNGEQLGFGIHFSIDRKFAEKYATDEYIARKGNMPQVYEVYLSIKKPLIADEIVREGSREFDLGLKLGGKKIYIGMDEDGTRVLYLQHALDASPSKKVLQFLQQHGYDGVIYKSIIGTRGVGAHITNKSKSFLVFEPNQIKSATNNNGQFNEKENSILLSKSPQEGESSLDLPEETFAHALQRKAQDKFNRFNVVKEFLEKEKGIKLSENADVYRAEERYHSKVTNQIDDFRDKVRNPLIKKWADAGYTKEQVEEYLKNRHAAEANAQIRKLSGNDSDTAYGITDEQAKEYLDKAPKELAKLADAVQAITNATQKLRLDNGIETQERVDAMRGAYKYYIPVRGDFEEQEAMRGSRVPGGRGFDVRYRPKRRLGHAARNEDVIGNIFQDYERAIVQVEKNRVAKSLALMAAEIQMPDLISIDQPVKRKVLRNEKAYGVLVKGELQDIFQTKEAAEQNKRFIIASQKNVTNSDITIAPITDQRLVSSASPMLDENEVMVYMNGHEIRIQIKDDLLAQAYKNLGVEALPTILRVGRAMNGWMSKAYTGYNPEFIFTNIQRDFTAGIINLTGEEGIQITGKAISNYPSSFASLLKYAATGESNKWIDSYRANGGNTGAAYLSDLERLGEEVNGEYAAYQGVLKNLKAGDRSNALRAAGRKAFNSSLKYIEHLNQAGENAFRLSAFRAMIESGKSVNEAAHIAKNVTINFNRKGEVGAELNALYLFFNANLQGTAALSHALFKGNHKYQAWGLIGGLTSLGYILGAGVGGFDDEDEYDAIGDSVKSRNIIISSGDGYVKIPVPYGAGFFYNLGRAVSEAERKDEVGKLPYQLAAIALEEFSPFNVASSEEAEFNSQKVMYGLMPTALRIPLEPASNFSTFSGREMYPEKEWYKSEPDNEKMWRNTKGTVYDITAQLLAKAGIEISPETLKYLTRTATGGSGTFVDSTVSAAMLKKEGAELETREIPFLRKAYGEVTIQDMRSRYGKAKEEAVTAAEKFNAAMRKNDLVTAKQLMGDKGELIALKNYADKLSDTIKYLRDMQDSIKLSEDYTVADKRLKIKELEKQEEKFYNQYLDIFKTKKSEMKQRQEK